MPSINTTLFNIAETAHARRALLNEVDSLLVEQPHLSPQQIIDILVEYYRPTDLATPQSASVAKQLAASRVERMDTIRSIAGRDTGADQDELLRRKPGFIEKVVDSVRGMFGKKTGPSKRELALGRIEKFGGSLDDLMKQAALPQAQRHETLKGLNDAEFKDSLSYAIQRERARIILDRTYSNPGKGHNQPGWNQQYPSEKITGVNELSALRHIQRQVDRGEIAKTEVKTGSKPPKEEEVAIATRNLNLNPESWATKVADFLTRPRTTVTSTPHNTLDAGRELVRTGVVTPRSTFFGTTPSIHDVGKKRRTPKASPQNVSEQLYNILNRKFR